ncbi:peroxiredoxin [Hymenobacter sp. BT664]|uniref:Peroxiredoxin n=1 Tax=Hymenobacter montanus TaxID=2771359 RepID=A0A927GI75_9BACT|nr:peroxiredoxin [Hymenobacter montanus]MBD2767080.1 peroxiredoxin [Hymenobacter montanus]
MAKDLLTLPDDLPVPLDDGLCSHLAGTDVGECLLPATNGQLIDISQSSTPRTVVFAYPRTGRPGESSPGGDDFWNAIPGARGCTPEVCRFRDIHAELEQEGATVYGLSLQSTAYQKEMTERLHVPFAILSDEGLQLTRALRLPTFTVDGLLLLRRFTLVLEGPRIRHVFYPVFPTTTHADEVLEWLRAHPLSESTRQK